MNILIKSISILMVTCLLLSCGDEEITRSFDGEVIVDFDYTVIPNPDGDGTVVTLTPSSTGATSYEIDWGDGSSISTVVSGDAAEHDYPNPSTTEIADQTSEYLVIVRAQANELADSPRPLEISVTYDLDGDGVFGEDECPRFAAGISPDSDERTGCPSIPSVAGIVSTRADSDVIAIFSDGVENPNFNVLGNDDFGVGYLPYSFNASDVNYYAAFEETTKFAVDPVGVVIGDLDYGDVLYRDVERDNNVLQYSFLDSVAMSFSAIDLTAANENVASLTNLSLEIYSNEVDFISISLMDGEEIYEFDDLTITAGTWNTIDLTLPAGLVDGSIDHISFKEGSSATASGSETIYLDNVYLYK